MTEKYCYNNILMILFWGGGREDEDKIMVKLDFDFFQTFLYWGIKKSTHSLFGAWSFLLVHIWFTHSEGPKDFVN